MEFNFSSPTNRRFLIRLGLSTGVLLLSLSVGKYLISKEIEGPLVWCIALVPGLAMSGMFYAYGMLILEQKDEFIRMLVIRQFIIATAIALSFATVWGFLEKYGLVEHLFTHYVTLAWFIGSAIGALTNRITHGAWGEMS